MDVATRVAVRRIARAGDRPQVILRAVDAGVEGVRRALVVEAVELGSRIVSSSKLRHLILGGGVSELRVTLAWTDPGVGDAVQADARLRNLASNEPKRLRRAT